MQSTISFEPGPFGSGIAIEGAKSAGKQLSWSDLRELQYPIFTEEPENFSEQVLKRRLRDVVPGAVAVIESFQPFKATLKRPITRLSPCSVF